MNAAAVSGFNGRSYQTPREDNSAIIEPPLSSVAELLKSNHQRIERVERTRFGSQTIGELRSQVRRELVSLGARWTQQSATQSASECQCTKVLSELEIKAARYLNGESIPIFVSGHQPELFHCGVWFKNAVISHLAQQNDGLAINLIIDHDLPKHGSISVPTMAGDIVHDSIRAYRSRASVAWEMIQPHIELNGQFVEELNVAMLGVAVDEPIANRFWPKLQRATSICMQIGDAITTTRHQIEREHGWSTLELPLSQLCDTWSFGIFVDELVRRANEVREAYNAARDVYRKANRIRNQAHPVPALGEELNVDKWIELPFWVYSNEFPEKKSLWLVESSNGFKLCDKRDEITIELGTEPTITQSIWLAALKAGIKIRPRALTTTMFLRLFAADLFVHGIGGGKYDQVTDLIMQSMWGIEPLAYLVASASLHLPIHQSSNRLYDSVSQAKEQYEWIQRLLRDAKYNPERLLEFLSPPKDELRKFKRLIKKKLNVLTKGYRELNPDDSTLPDKQQWHNQIATINEKMSDYFETVVSEFQSLLASARNYQRQQKVIQSREYAFVIFGTEAMDRLDALIERLCPTSDTRSNQNLQLSNSSLS
jgi:uncharacterized protein YaaR (DUF327 family)